MCSVHGSEHIIAWPDLSTHRNYLSLCLLYDIINKHQSLPLPDSVKFNKLSTRSHSLCIVPLCSTINCYHFSFFVNIIFLWNSVPHSILSLSCTGFRRTLYCYLCNYCYCVFLFLYRTLYLLLFCLVFSSLCCTFFCFVFVLWEAPSCRP